MRRLPVETRLLVAVVALAVVLQLPLTWWLVEDAAISFAYAKNIADGHGAVSFPGGERVEGYSNPLWVAIWVVVCWLSLSPFLVKAMLGLLCGVGAVGVAWLWGRTLPIGRPHVTGLAAAAVVAAAAPHAIWSQGGLENSLFSLFMALIGWRLCASERDEDRWVPLFALGLTLTRPEGVLYAFAAAVVSVFSAGSLTGAARRVERWFTTYLVPFAAYHAARYAYFAYPFPATYYAKVGERDFIGLDWKRSGWRQLRWFVHYGALAPLVVLLPVGASGLRPGIRRTLGVAIGLALAIALVPLTELGTVRAGTLALAFTALPLLALFDRDRRGPLLAAIWLWIALFFYLRGNGDWMRGYRFVSFMVVPGAILLASAAGHIAELLQTRFSAPRQRVWPFAVAAAIFLAGQIGHYAHFLNGVETTPYGVRTRLIRYEQLSRQLDLEHAVVGDHDMGAMMWWWSPELTIRDVRGLVDMPFAIHGNRPMVTDHELKVRTPIDYASPYMAAERALKRRGWYRKKFVRVPGWPVDRYPTNGTLKIRRTLLLGPPDPEATSVVSFDDSGRPEAVLHGLHIESPEVAPGTWVFVSAGIGLPQKKPVSVVMFLTKDGEVATSWELPLALGWVEPQKWRAGEISHGRHVFRLPVDIPEGTYDVGVVAFDETGRSLAASPHRGSRLPEVPALDRHEARLDLQVHVVSPAEHARQTALDLVEAHRIAKAGDCEDAEAAWDRARHHGAGQPRWRDSVRPAMAETLARCWAKRARGPLHGDRLHERVADLVRARQWDPLAEQVERASHRVSAKAWHRGMAARADGDHATAFTWFSASVTADPSRAWARRYAEEARLEMIEAKRSPKPPSE